MTHATLASELPTVPCPGGCGLSISADWADPLRTGDPRPCTTCRPLTTGSLTRLTRGGVVRWERRTRPREEDASDSWADVFAHSPAPLTESVPCRHEGGRATERRAA